MYRYVKNYILFLTSKIIVLTIGINDVDQDPVQGNRIRNIAVKIICVVFKVLGEDDVWHGGGWAAAEPGGDPSGQPRAGCLGPSRGKQPSILWGPGMSMLQYVPTSWGWSIQNTVIVLWCWLCCNFCWAELYTVSLRLKHDAVSLRLKHDAASLRLKYDAASLRLKYDAASLRLKHDAASLRLNHDAASLRLNHDASSLRLNHDTASRVVWLFHCLMFAWG